MIIWRNFSDYYLQLSVLQREFQRHALDLLSLSWWWAPAVPFSRGPSAVRTVPQLLAAQGMVYDEDKKHKVDVKQAAAGSLCFQSVS